MRELTRNEQSELNDIAWHWDTAYHISFDGDVYVAYRMGYPEHLLTAWGTAELRQLIRADYQEWLSTLKEASAL